METQEQILKEQRLRIEVLRHQLLFDYSGLNVPLVAVCNVPPIAFSNVPPQKWLL